MRRGASGPIVSVPSGNFGNLTAGLIAKRIGLPVAQFVAATNVNDAVPDYLESGIYEPRPSIATVANAMDVGAPEQLRAGAVALRRRPRRRCGATSPASRTRTRRSSKRSAACTGTHGYLLDPHSAIAWLALQDRLADEPEAHGVFLATAHPAKFREVVEPAIGRRVAAAACAGRCAVASAAFGVDAGRLRGARRLPASCASSQA